MKQENVEIFTNTRIKSVLYLRNYFNVKLDNNSIISSKIVIGSYGKRDLLDRQLNRDFFKAKTGYMAVKYHIKTSYAANEIGLDNFKDGYCGISKIEEDKYCLCYLTKRSNIAGLNSIKQMEEEVLYKNSRLKHIFEHSEFLFSKPEVINEISISPKSLIENHILMCGDSAGMITTLCGNGMAMAIHSAKIVSELIIAANINKENEISTEIRSSIEKCYARQWKRLFGRRIYWGRKLHYFSGKSRYTDVFLRTVQHLPILKDNLINLTHGKTIF